MVVQNCFYALEIDDRSGALLSISNYKREFLLPGERPLFTIAFLDENGNQTRLSSDQSESIVIRNESQVAYIEFIFKDFLFKVTIRFPEGQTFCYWSYELANNTQKIVEWIDFPTVVTPNDLKGTGGESVLLWTAAEGCLIEDIGLREQGWLKYKEIGTQGIGYSGLYPGANPMQFMAYYSEQGGLYFAAHDSNANLKTFEFYPFEKGIRLECRVFPGSIADHQSLGFEIVLGVFEGDWQDACEIYRSWMESSDLPLPKKLYQHHDLPKWLEESPIVVAYPVRGTKDTGDMTPNLFFPYTKALPYIEELGSDFDSKIMALPMHWEGTAPWAPPFVWPPYGGEEQFKLFIDKLHASGNLAGVYCSGIGFTTESFLEPAYPAKEIYESGNYQELMCQTPKEEIVQSKIIDYPIRKGYDMCAAKERVWEIVIDEVKKIAACGCDYAQYFDQNLGGSSCLCYAKDHNHPPVPGKWQAECMRALFKRIHTVLKEMSSDMIIGCEAAAAEPFISELPFNDLRYNIHLFYGKPVPAYNYVYHEYINNFMGNQNTIDSVMDFESNPDNLLFRIAYSFIAGDMLTVILGKDGKIIWNWGCCWDVPVPDQENIKTLIKNLNRYRTGWAKKFLHYGRMVKTDPIITQDIYQIILKNGYKHCFPSLLSSKWMSQDGQHAQFIANFQNKSLSFSFLNTPKYVVVDHMGIAIDASNGKDLIVPPLSTIMFIEKIDI